MNNKLQKIVSTTVNGFLKESIDGYSEWKRKNVTLRGIKVLGSDNGVYGSFGKGLYTVPLGNRVMAKTYGKIHFVVNAIPKNPKVVDSLNSAEIFRQKIINSFCEKDGKTYDVRYFDGLTTMESEMLIMGYDGLIIKGREMVNYTPKDIKFFENENDLKDFYNRTH